MRFKDSNKSLEGFNILDLWGDKSGKTYEDFTIFREKPYSLDERVRGIIL